MIKTTFIDLLKNYNKTFELYANNKCVGRYNLVPLKEVRELWIMDIDSIISEYSDLYNVEIGCSEEYDKFAQVTNQVWLYGNSGQQNRICECIERVYHTAYPPEIVEFVDKLIKPYHFVSLDNFLDILSEESSIPVVFADLEEKLETFQWKDRNAVTIQLMERLIGNSGGTEFFAIHEDFHNTSTFDTDYKRQFENHFGKDNLRYDMIRGWDSLSYFNHSNMTFVYKVSYPNYTAYCPIGDYAVSSDGSLIKSAYKKENNMNSNSVAKEIEKQTGLKRSTKTKKYAQECGRGNICYAYRFAGYKYSGDFHVAKDYGNTFEVITDSPEGESKLNDILQVLNNLGLEIVTQGRTHIGFKIPEDENKWYGADGSYRKGKWHLYKNYGRDGEYKLYNSEDENSVYNITAYSPSQAKYSADHYIEQLEKGEIMNSKKSIKSGYYDNPDRFIIGLSIATHMDLFEANYEEYTGGKNFNWDKDGDIFNQMSDELDRIVENNIAQKLGHTAVEEYHAGNDYAISTYEVSFWGYRNQPEDIQVLKDISKYADDDWSDNGRVTYAYYDTNFYAGDISSFLDKWGEKGVIYGVMAEALANAITIGIDFPEDLIDSDLVMNSHKLIKSDRYQEDVLETYLTPTYAEDRLYDDVYDCQKHNYLVRKYFKEGLRGDELIDAVADSINDDIPDWDCTAFHGLDEENDIFDPQDVYDDMKIQNSHKPVKSGFDITPEQNKFNWAYNDWYGHFHMNLDKVPQYLEGVKWCDANKGSEFYNELCEKYNIYPTGDREKAAFYNALKELGEIESVTSSKKRRPKTADEKAKDEGADITCSRKPVKSSRKTIPGLKFNSDDKSGDNYLVQYKVEDNKLLDKIKDYLYYDVDDKTVLQPGNVFVGFMYDKDGSSLLAAQVVDTESSTWDLSPEECKEIFGL